jgi:phage/plasmid primase-like uncharacterized protein
MLTKTKHINKTIVKNAAQGRWKEIFENICPELEDAVKACPGHVPDPVAGGKDGFRLFRDVDETGASYSNKEGAFTDGFATLMYATESSFYEVLEDVANYLGITGSSQEQPVRTPKPKAVKPSFELAPEEAIRRKHKLNTLWSQASKMSDARSERARRYLVSRAITIDFSHVEAFRFHPAAWYKDKNGQLQNAPAWIQKWQLPDGTPVQIHKILLSKRGNGKLEIEKPKRMMKPTGRMTGGAIRIGEPALGTLSVATGVETALSVTEVTGQPCWSTLSDALLKGFIPPEDVNHLTIWGDNDKPDELGRNSGKQAAYALAQKLQLERPELKVVVKIPPREGEDWNDLLVKAEFEAFRK